MIGSKLLGVFNNSCNKNLINFHKLDGLINCNDDWNFDGVVVDEIDNSNCCWWNKLWWMRLG